MDHKYEVGVAEWFTFLEYLGKKAIFFLEVEEWFAFVKYFVSTACRHRINGKKLSNSQACCLAQLCLAAA